MLEYGKVKLPKIVAKRLHSSLKKIDSHLDHEYDESLKSQNNDEIHSQASRNSSFYNFERHLKKIEKMNKSMKDKSHSGGRGTSQNSSSQLSYSNIGAHLPAAKSPQRD